MIYAIDEVGRGAFAGPIVAACACISGSIYDSRPIKNLKDSKLYKSFEERKEIRDTIIKSNILIDKSYAAISAAEINFMGIEKANELAFLKCLSFFTPTHEDTLIVDGSKSYNISFPGKMVICPKADSKYWQVSIASILAKCFRDYYMRLLDSMNPEYVWKTNFGSGTKKHQEAIKKFGVTEQHRTQFINTWKAKSQGSQNV